MDQWVPGAGEVGADSPRKCLSSPFFSASYLLESGEERKSQGRLGLGDPPRDNVARSANISYFQKL